MRKVLAAIVVGMLSGVFPLSVQADNQPQMVYGYPDVSVWTTKRNADGQLDNPLLKLAEQLFDEAGIEWQSRPLPAKRLFKYLKEGVVPFTMLVRAPSLQECCLYSEKPVASTELRVFRQAGTQAIASQEDLAGKHVITIRGYSYGGLGKYLRDPQNNVDIQEAATHKEAFLLFERGRGDYVIDYQGPAEEVLAGHPIDDIVYDTYTRLDVFLVLSRNYPNASAVLRRLEAVANGLEPENQEMSQ